jgi:hypothetical protein
LGKNYNLKKEFLLRLKIATDCLLLKKTIKTAKCFQILINLIACKKCIKNFIENYSQLSPQRLTQNRLVTDNQKIQNRTGITGNRLSHRT